MMERIDQRVRSEAQYIAEHKATVRQTAARFCVSKSTVHKDLGQRLQQMDDGLYAQVRQVLENNKAERHLRGGEATKSKFAGKTKISAK